MIGLIQRVSSASVDIDDVRVAKINNGLLVLIGIEKGDTEYEADKLLKKILAYRLFSDSEDKMNLSLSDINGSLLLVPQFTLAANTNKGLRPSFAPAATPEVGQKLFDYIVEQAHQTETPTQTGQFGADMQVSLTNDGPVTFWLQVAPNTQNKVEHA